MVYARHHLPTLGAEGRLDLVAIVGGILHADDLLHTAKTAKELYQLGLLQVELFFIGEVLEGAASAFFGVGAGEHILSFLLRPEGISRRRHIAPNGHLAPEGHIVYH